MKKEYILPGGWKVLYKLRQSPFHRDFMIIAKQKDKVAIFRFDGIEEYPTMIEQYYISKFYPNK